ncbi:hypothetical protein [Thiorhodovibrio litoralis]|nr:hypothetical protein [Thiorhodovibrio litoralis]MBK5968547.1 hypothetical protein [Thiorhodovibrio winogradskyi]
MLVVLVVANAFWVDFFDHLLPITWLAILTGMAVALSSLPLAIQVLQRITAPWLTTRLCPRCDTSLEVTGGGFVDGTPPSKHELIVYSAVCAVPMLADAIITALVA